MADDDTKNGAEPVKIAVSDESGGTSATSENPDSGPAHEKVGKKGNKKELLDAHSIQVKVYSPYQIYYDGAAISISAENDTGPFDILPRHHNFMTLVNACEVVIRAQNSEDKKIRITRGVMHVRSNKVTLFLDV